jgi:hypothetical protein
MQAVVPNRCFASHLKLKLARGGARILINDDDDCLNMLIAMTFTGSPAADFIERTKKEVLCGYRSISVAMPVPYGERCRFAVVTSRGTLIGIPLMQWTTETPIRCPSPRAAPNRKTRGLDSIDRPYTARLMTAVLRGFRPPLL